MTAGTNDSEEEGMVPKEAVCPRCGERRVDELILHEDDTVDCLSCDNHYPLPVMEKPRPGREEGGQA